jgi:signal transduction histidine kinase
MHDENNNSDNSGTDIESLGPNTDLETVLAAWHTATLRLEKTHESLRDEVHRLTDELEIKNRELARKNRLADLGQIAAHVAHEVRNGLVPVTLYMSLLRRHVAESPACLTVVDKLETSFTAIDAAVTDLLQFTSDREPKCESFVLRDLVDEVCDSLAPQLAAQQVTTHTDVERGTSVWADRQMLRRALLNLVLNALDAMPGGGELDLIAHIGNQTVEIEVADSGSGIADDVMPRLFDPFFTTKPSGTGLGLAIVQRIAETHGGDVLVANCPQGGAALTIRIPRIAASSSQFTQRRIAA